MTTTADVLASCRNTLMTGRRDQRNKVAGALDAVTDTVMFVYDLKQIDLGTKISVELEDMYVWDASPSAKAVTVSRGAEGSTAAAHADGTVATINPHFSDAEIFQAVNDELRALSGAGLFHMRTVDLTYNAAVDGYDLTGVTDVLSVHQLRAKQIGPEKEWPVVSRGLWEHQRDLDTAIFPSGQAVFIRSGLQPGYPVRVTYKAPFTVLAGLTDNVVSVSGLHAEALDLLSLGAGIRLTVGREVARNFDESQGDTRRAAEVPPGANQGANRGLLAWRMQRLKEERLRLGQRYPMAVR